MSKALQYIEDSILSLLQRRCVHPGHMVAVDILEGCADGIQMKYCRRCGAVKTLWQPDSVVDRYVASWRRPDPHLWRDPVVWLAKLRRRFLGVA